MMQVAATAPRDVGRGATAAAVSLTGVRKTYGTTVAVDSLDLTVPAGSVYALVGPNGAGKTTTVECVIGLRKPDAGTIRVLGLDPVRDRTRLFQRVGVQLQESHLPERLSVGELLRLFASFYDRSTDLGELLEAFDLTGRERIRYGALSGGQKRRLDVALAFVADPELVVLDEPTSGLDPHSRLRIWTVIEERRAAGNTVLVTTHYLEEAEEYCDHVVVIDRARLVSAGDPRDLLREHGLGVRVSVPAELAVGVSESLLADTDVAYVEAAGDRLLVYGRDASIYDLVARACPRVDAALGLEIRPARLEDLFLLLTGREYRER